MSSNLNTRFAFRSMAVGDVFAVSRFRGEEFISRPFRFEIDLVSAEHDVDLDAVVGRLAYLEIEKNGRTRTIHGVIAEIEQGGEGENRSYFYRAVLVPRVWLLSLTVQNQIYQNLSVAQIVEQELLGQRANPGDAARIGLTALDYEIRLTRSYATKEYVVQFRETDLDFISRLMEHEGIFYYFQNDNEREKLVIGDHMSRFPVLPGNPVVEFRTGAGLASFEEDSVQSLVCRRRPVPRKVVLKDHNYRLPHVQLQADAPVDDERGVGFCSSYGEHFKLPEEGHNLAQTRAEEINCHAREFSGSGTCVNFQTGVYYTLRRHFREDFNQEYLITSVCHQGEQALRHDTSEGKTSYRNDFTCIPAGLAYRPERITPKPRMYGIMNATIDASGSGDRAELDDQGRYKVVMPFDLTGAGEGKASRYIRMAQPYGGSNNGMHFPLLKGTEVVWTCIDGDPDRPIIVGTVPNPLNKSVVTRANNTSNVIRTPSGILMEFNDGLAESGNASSTTTTGNTLGAQQQRQAPPGFETYLPKTNLRMQRLAEQRHYGPNDPTVTSITASTTEVAEGSNATFTVNLTVPSGAVPVTVGYEYREGASPTWTAGTATAMSSSANSSSSVSIDVPTTVNANLSDSRLELRITSVTDNSNNSTTYSASNGPAATVTLLDQAIVASGSTKNRRLKIKVPNYNTTDDTSYLRLGAQDIDEDLEQLGEVRRDGKLLPRNAIEKIGIAPDGWYEYTKGDRTVKVEGKSRRILLKGNTDYTSGDVFEFGTGAGISHFWGATHECTSGLASSVSCGGRYEANFGVGMSTSMALNAEYNVGIKFDVSFDDNITLAKKHEVEANDNILLKVDPDDSGFEMFMEKFSPWLSGLSAGAQGLWSANLATGLVALLQDPEVAALEQAGLAAGSCFAGLALAARECYRRKCAVDSPVSQVKLDRTSALIGAGTPVVPSTEPPSNIKFTATEAIIKCGDKASITLKSTGEVEIKGTQINFLVGTKPMLTVKDNVWVQTGGLIVTDGNLSVDKGAAYVNTDLYADTVIINEAAFGSVTNMTLGPKPPRHGARPTPGPK